MGKTRKSSISSSMGPSLASLGTSDTKAHTKRKRDSKKQTNENAATENVETKEDTVREEKKQVKRQKKENTADDVNEKVQPPENEMSDNEDTSNKTDTTDAKEENHDSPVVPETVAPKLTLPEKPQLDASMSVEELKEKLKQMESRYNALKQLRETEPEGLLRKLMESTTQEEKAFDKLENSLNSKIESLNEKLNESTNVDKTGKPDAGTENIELSKKIDELTAKLNEQEKTTQELRKENKDLNDQLFVLEKNNKPESTGEVEQLESMVQAYKELTSAHLDVTVKEGTKELNLIVANKQKRKAIKFTIELPDDVEKPGQFTPTGNLSLFPDFLQTEIEFERSDTWILFSKLLQAVE